MAVSASRVSVGTTATPLNTGDLGGIAGSGVVIKNLSETEVVYVGGSDVTDDEGYPIMPGGEMGVDFETSGETLYGIVSSGTVELAVLRVGA